MAYPRVFVSSTCYDLSEVRDSLTSFIRSYHFDPVLSDKGDVFYHPDLHTHESCIHEIKKCNMFILIIGGRFGGKYISDSSKSIVNAEYKAARLNDIPIFCFVKREVYEDHRIYQSNKNKTDIIKKISFPSIEKQEYAIDIFGFIDEVRHHVMNNAFFTFEYARDIEDNLRKQWAGMFCDYLDSRRVNKELVLTTQLLDQLTIASKKTEEIIKNVYKYLDKENAEKAIQDIDTEVKARQFFETIMKVFLIDKLEIKDLDKLINECMSLNWVDFLMLTGNFYIYKDMPCFDTDENGVEKLFMTDDMFCSLSQAGMGVNGDLSEKEISRINELKQLYEVFLSLAPEQKRQILLEYTK